MTTRSVTALEGHARTAAHSEECRAPVRSRFGVYSLPRCEVACAMRHFDSQEGPFALYRGLGVVVVGAAPAQAGKPTQKRARCLHTHSAMLINLSDEYFGVPRKSEGFPLTWTPSLINQGVILPGLATCPTLWWHSVWTQPQVLDFARPGSVFRQLRGCQEEPGRRRGEVRVAWRGVGSLFQFLIWALSKIRHPSWIPFRRRRLPAVPKRVKIFHCPFGCERD